METYKKQKIKNKKKLSWLKMIAEDNYTNIIGVLRGRNDEQMWMQHLNVEHLDIEVQNLRTTTEFMERVKIELIGYLI